jgi:multiple sugar transport system permease protein
MDILKKERRWIWMKNDSNLSNQFLWGKDRLKKQMLPYLLLTPAFLFIGFFMFYPVMNTFLLSLQNYVLTQRSEWGFIGIGNFKKLFYEDPIFWTALRNSIIWTISNVLLQTFLGLYLALLLNRKFKGRGLYRAVAFSPWAVAGVLVAMMWSFMYNENFGVLNAILMRAGLIHNRLSWFSSSTMAMAAMVLATTWRGVPFFAISILASLQTIPEEIYESCDVDGANSWQKLFYITLPMIKDTLILTTLLRTIWTLNIIDIIFSMTKGGPNFSTLTLPVYVMLTFIDSLDLGYASTIAIATAVLLLMFSGIYLALGRFGKEDYS